MSEPITKKVVAATPGAREALDRVAALLAKTLPRQTPGETPRKEAKK